MLIKMDWGAYNDRRYGKPWIAKVTAWAGGVPTLEWGHWYGSANDGGHLEIEAEPEDIVRYGQKDNRNPRKTESVWAIVQPDGRILDVTESRARKHWRQRAVPDLAARQAAAIERLADAVQDVLRLGGDAELVDLTVRTALASYTP